MHEHDIIHLEEYLTDTCIDLIINAQLQIYY